MEISLFAKYKLLLKETEGKEKELRAHVTEKTGLVLDEKEVLVRDTKVILRLSSAKRGVFLLKKGKEIIEEKGYIVSFG